MESYFQPSIKPSRRATFVVHGLGGTGKTQICSYFVRSQQERFSAIFWLDGSSKDSLRRSLGSMVTRIPENYLAQIKVTAKQLGDVNTVLQWLSMPHNTEWLVVFDNVDRDWQIEPTDPLAYNFEDFLPFNDHGNVLITTRLARLRRPDASIHLGNVPPDLGRKIIELRIGRDVQDADVLVEKLEGLPLALAQAGAYIQQTNISVSKYLRFYNDMWARLVTMQHKIPLPEYQRSIITTWKMSYDQVSVIDPHAARLLDLWAFLCPGDIWFDLLSCLHAEGPGADIPDWLRDLAVDELSFRQSIRTLLEYSLLVPAQGCSDPSIHPVVHNWCLENVSSVETKQKMSGWATMIISQKIKMLDDNSREETEQRIVPHAKVLGSRSQFFSDDERMISRYVKVAHFLRNREGLVEADHLYRWALKRAEDTAGPTDLTTLNIVKWLAVTCEMRMHVAESEQLHQRAIEGYERLLGPEDVKTLGAMNNYGLLLCMAQSRYEEAEDQFRRVLDGYDKAQVKGSKVFNMMNNLGLAYMHQGKLLASEAMYRKALRAKENSKGLDHPSTLDTVWNLGLLYSKHDRLQEAEELFQRALRGFERIWGPNHTATLDAIDTLSRLHAQQGELPKAEQLQTLVLERNKKTMSRDSWPIIRSMCIIGLIKANQEDFDEAERMYEQVLLSQYSTDTFWICNLRQQITKGRETLSRGQKSEDPKVLDESWVEFWKEYALEK